MSENENICNNTFPLPTGVNRLNIIYICRTILDDVPSGGGAGLFIKILLELGPTPTDDQLRILMNNIVGNSPQSFRMAERFGPNTDPPILSLFTPSGSINANPGIGQIPFTSKILEQHADNNAINLVSTIEYIGNLDDVFPTLDGSGNPKNSLSNILGNFTTIQLDGSPVPFLTTLTSLIGTDKITANASPSITQTIGDTSTIKLDGSTPAASLTAAIGSAPIATSFVGTPTITDAIGDISFIKLDSRTPATSLAGAIGGSPIASTFGGGPTITQMMGDVSTIKLDAANPPASLSFAIGNSPIATGFTTPTLTSVIGDISLIKLDGNIAVNSLAAGIGENITLDSDIPDRSNIIKAVNTAHSHKTPFLLTFCSAQGDTRLDPPPTSNTTTIKKPYNVNMVSLLQLSKITGIITLPPLPDTFFECLYLVRKVAKGKTGSYTVTNGGNPYTNKTNCKTEIGPVISNHAPGTDFNTGANNAEVKAELLAEICGQYED